MFEGSHDVFLDIVEGRLEKVMAYIKRAENDFRCIMTQKFRVGPFDNFYRANLLEASALVGRLSLVQRLLQYFDPSDNDNLTIILAAWGGSLAVVNCLLEDQRVNPGAQWSTAFVWAIAKHDNVIAMRLFEDKRVLLNDWHDNPIRLAARFGNVEMVGKLLTVPEVNPMTDKNASIRIAAQNGHENVVRLLYQTLVERHLDPLQHLKSTVIGKIKKMIGQAQAQAQAQAQTQTQTQTQTAMMLDNHAPPLVVPSWDASRQNLQNLGEMDLLGSGASQKRTYPSFMR